MRQRWADGEIPPSATRTPHPLGATVFAKGKPHTNVRNPAHHRLGQAGQGARDRDLIGQMLALCPDNMIGRRDRALLAFGFAGAFRRSELCALDVTDLTETPDGLRVLIRRSKGDQEGQGQEVAIPRGYRLGRGGADLARRGRDQ